MAHPCWTLELRRFALTAKLARLRARHSFFCSGLLLHALPLLPRRLAMRGGLANAVSHLRRPQQTLSCSTTSAADSDWYCAWHSLSLSCGRVRCLSSEQYKSVPKLPLSPVETGVTDSTWLGTTGIAEKSIRLLSKSEARELQIDVLSAPTTLGFGTPSKHGTYSSFI